MTRSKGQKLMACLLSLCMLVGMLSGMTLSVSAADSVTVESSHHNTNQGDGIVLMKKATPNDDGTVDISIGAYTTGEVVVQNASTPTDIILVLDVSGSMNDDVTTSVISGYTPVTGESQSQWYILWTERWYGFNSADSTYYIDQGEKKIPVTRAGRDDNDYDFYTDGINYYYPIMESGYTNQEHNYPKVQFYSPVISSSEEQNKMEVLKKGAKAFIETTAAKNAGIADASQKHRIAIVKYADDNYFNGTSATSTPSLVEGNNKNSSEYNYTQVVKGFTTVEGTGATALTNAIDSLSPGGATAIDYGMRLATELFADVTKNDPAAASARNEVVIAFTDGEPNHSSGFDATVANSALAYSSALKSTSGVSIYSISMAEGADASVLSANQTNRFTHFLSSNYPSATNMSVDPASGDINKGYYMTPDGDHALESIFVNIMQSIGTPHITMGPEAVLVDSISSYFDLEDGTNSITLKTVAKTADGWEDTGEADDSISYVLSPDGKTIRVTGFDFDENYISTTNRGTDENPFYGKMLLLQMNVTPNNAIIDAGAVIHGGDVPTNADEAFLTDSFGAERAEVTTPTLKLPTITYTYTVDGEEATQYAKFYRLPGTEFTPLSDDVISKEGYSFSGWSQTEGFTVPNENVEITGNFTPNNYTVRYQYSGTVPAGAPEQLPTEAQYAYNSEVTVAADPVVENYTFSGWAPQQMDVTVTNGKFTMPAKEVVLIGHFTQKSASYKVEHYLETLTDGVYETEPEVEESFIGEAGETVTATYLNRFEGFEYNEAKSASTISGEVNEEGTLVLEVYYDRKEYPVTYGYDGAVPDGAPELSQTENYKYGETVTIAERPTPPAGYNFTGWYRGTQNNPISGTFTMPAREVTILGIYTAGTATPYKVEHYNMDIYGEYPSVPDVTEPFTGTTGHAVTAEPITTFEGFTLDEDAEGTVASGTISGDGRLVLKLYYERNKYKLTYNYEGDIPDNAPELPLEEEVYFGADVIVTDPAEPPTGYESFFGWYRGIATEENITTSFTMPSRDVELLGYFIPDDATVYTVEHYLMDFTGTEYVIDDSLTETLNGTTGHTVTAHPLPNLITTGFTYNEVMSEDTNSGEIEADGSLVLKLYYDRKTYKVTYSYEGDIPDDVPELPDEVFYFFDEDVTVEEKAIAPSGYSFVGWYRGTQTNPVEGTFKMPNRDVTILGYFKPNENTPYTVLHFLQNVDGSYPVDDADAEVSEVLEGETDAAVTANHLTSFIGFTYDSTVPGTVAEGTIAGDGSLVLRLYYKRNTYKVTYAHEGVVPAGTPAAPSGEEEYLYGQTVTVRAKTEPLEGYNFIGWYRGTSDRLVEGTFQMPAFNVHLLGQFAPSSTIPYRVEHYLQNEAQDGYVLDFYDDRIGTTGETVSAIERDYPGFTYNEDISIPSGEILGDGTFALKFYYDRNVYDVTYLFEGLVPETLDRTDYETTTSGVLFGKEVEVTVIPENEYVGYTFSGWTTEDATIINGKFNMPAKHVLLKAHFTAELNTYKVMHWTQNLPGDTSGEEVPEKGYYTLQEYEEFTNRRTGALVEAIPKAYMGFTPREDNVLTGRIKGDGSLVLNVYYDRQMHDVSYIYYDDGNLPDGRPAIPSTYDKENVPYGTELTVEDKLELEGYVFDGWYTLTATVSENGENLTYQMPANDVIFFARYLEEYDVKYELNGGTGAEGFDYTDKKVAAGIVITVNAAPTRRNYSFEGWKVDTTVYDPAQSVTVNSDITFVAQWDYNGGGGGGGSSKYVLTYDSNGGTEFPDERYSPGTTVELDNFPKKDGYIFDGWHTDEHLNEDAEEVTMTKNITVYAAWIEDNGAAGNGHDTPSSLNGDDHFAYVVGYPDGNVKPHNNITRAEVTSIFFRLLKDDTRNSNLAYTNAFNDADSDDWFNTAVSTMSKLGIVNGRKSYKFAPNEYITRAEFAVICARFDNSEYVVSDEFTDVNGHWAEEEIHEAAAHGWIRGYENGTFRPDEYITRAEAMTMINRVLNRVPESDSDLLPNMVVWSDNFDKTAWYYLPVQEATNSHNFEMKNNIYERWTFLEEARDWTQYE